MASSASRAVGKHDVASLQHVAAVGDRERDVRVLLDDENGHPGLVHLLDDLEVSLDEDRGEAHRGLVHEQEPGAGHERPPHRQHLLLAARERAGELRAALVEEREEPVDALEVVLEVVLAQIRAHLEVLEHGHGREHAPVLGDDRHAEPDPVAGGALGHVLSREADRPERGLTIPRIVFRVVDFPEAFPPRRHTSSPSATSSEMPWRMWIGP